MNKDKTDGKALEVLTIYLVVGLILSVAIKWLWDLSSREATEYGYAVATFTFLVFINQFLLLVPANHGVVLQNYLLAKTLQGTNENQKKIDKLAIPRGQRAVMAGLRFKLPWETPIGDPISFKRDTIVTSTVSVITSNGSKYSVRWQAPLTPVPGRYLPRFLLVDEKVAKAFFEGYFSNQVINKFRFVDGLEAIKNLNDPKKGLNAWFSSLLGGPDEISDTENEQGWFTGTPTIVEIIPDESDKKLAQAQAAAEKDANAVAALVAHGVNANVALASVLLTQGIDVDLIAITGLEGQSDGKEGRGEGKGGSNHTHHILAELINRNNNDSKKKKKKRTT